MPLIEGTQNKADSSMESKREVTPGWGRRGRELLLNRFRVYTGITVV